MGGTKVEIRVTRYLTMLMRGPSSSAAEMGASFW